MIAVPAGSVTHEHVGRTDQSGFVILAVHSLPLHWPGASLTVRHPATGAEQVWDLTGQDVLWLREDDPPPAPPARWLQIAETIAQQVTTVTCDGCGRTTVDVDLWDAEVSTGRVLCDPCWDRRQAP
jgi:4-hydroxy-3-methylbut-2-en-1-yl diphosphate synthase IspG/GcpE